MGTQRDTREQIGEAPGEDLNLGAIHLRHERVDDVPIIVGLAQKLDIPACLDHCLGQHGLHQGLTNGEIAAVWLAYILTEGDHRKCAVQDWASQRQHTLECLLGKSLRSVDFTDDRLGILLQRLSNDDAWRACEAALWRSTVEVFALSCQSVRLDSTTTYGYHTPVEDGVMQFGHSKDHRPDLPQLKLMAAAAEPNAQLLCTDILAGQRADDRLYLPLVERVRKTLGSTGLLYVGDSKMASLETRAGIHCGGDYYLAPLAMKGGAEREIIAWVQAVTEGSQAARLLWYEGRLLGTGYEFTRQVSNGDATWNERVQVIRSSKLASEQAKTQKELLEKAAAKLWVLTDNPRQGKRQYRDEAALQAAIGKILTQYRVDRLLRVRYEKEAAAENGKPIWRIVAVEQDETAIALQCRQMGWRVYVTNAESASLSLERSIACYREGWTLERDFHLIKDRPLGIRPLYVRTDAQIIGLTRLLTLALRLATLLENQVRRGLDDEKRQMVGLYEGQSQRATSTPTGRRILRAIAQAQITLTRLEMGGQSAWQLSPLPPILEEALSYLQLPKAIYNGLVAKHVFHAY